MNRFARAAIAVCFAGVLIAPAAAQSVIRSAPARDRVIESYIAQISYDDLFNSSGERLGAPWQVLRQDRANFHRYGVRHHFDEWDSFFGDSLNRAIMEDMMYAGSISGQAARDIMSGQAVVLVEILGAGTTGRSLRVTVAR